MLTQKGFLSFDNIVMYAVIGIVLGLIVVAVLATKGDKESEFRGWYVPPDARPIDANQHWLIFVIEVDGHSHYFISDRDYNLTHFTNPPRGGLDAERGM